MLFLVDFFISGNIRHFLAKEFHNIHIVTPNEFINLTAKLIIK